MDGISVAVLAGGRSRRMGKDKALLDVGGRPLALYVADRFRAVSDDVFVVGKGRLPFPVVLDASEIQTPLVGVLTALRAARHPLVLVCACDMPAASPELAQLLAKRVGGHDAAAPVHMGAEQPLHAVWSTRSAPRVESLLGAGELSVKRALQALRTVYVDVADERAFTNVNAPEDLAALSDLPSGGSSRPAR